MTTLDHDKAQDTADVHLAQPAAVEAAGTLSDDVATTAAVVAVVAVGAVIFEAALIPGMVLGVAAMLAPKVFPNVDNKLQPAFRATVRGAYRAGRKARHAFAEAQEQVCDVVAEEKAASAAKEI
jgi:hypothetical protein